METYEIKYKDKFMAEQEIMTLKNWFKDDYTYQEQKFRRLIALNKQDDDGIEGEVKLQQLYEDAEQKRVRIQELEELITLSNMEKHNETEELG